MLKSLEVIACEAMVEELNELAVEQKQALFLLINGSENEKLVKSIAAHANNSDFFDADFFRKVLQNNLKQGKNHNRHLFTFRSVSFYSDSAEAPSVTPACDCSSVVRSLLYYLFD